MPLLDLPPAEQDAECERLAGLHQELGAALRTRLAAFRRLLGPGDGTLGPGTHFGDYELLRQLGMGGMGIVWLARQRRAGTERLVALKMIHHAGLFSTQARERFRREAHAAMRVDHPGLCPVYDVGEVDQTPYLAMRLIPGCTLAEHIRLALAAGQPLDLTRAVPGNDPTRDGPPASPRQRLEAILAVLEGVARAAHAAHLAGLVHRDIKPANVMVTPEGQAVLLDFGLARDVGAGGDGPTRTGQVVGTPAYLAPEQIETRGRNIGPAADIHALAATLFECVTLRPPFVGATDEELFLRILRDPAPRARRFVPELPRQLEVVLESALRKEPERRYPSALEFAEDLQRLRTHEPIRARRTGVVLRTRLWVRRNPVVATVLVLLGVATAGALWQTRTAVMASGRAERNFDQAGRAVQELATIARELDTVPGSEAVRRQILERALTFHAEFVERQGDDPRTHRAQAIARVAMGQLLVDLGRGPEARAQHELAVAALQPLVEADGGDDELAALRLAEALNRLADQAADTAETRLARSCRALSTIRRLDARTPGHKDHLVQALASHANKLCMLGRPEEALPVLAEAGDLCLRHEDVPLERRGQTWVVLAMAQYQAADLPAARASVDRAMAALRRCATTGPAARRLRDALLQSVLLARMIRHRQGDTADEAALCVEAVALGESLVRDFPETVQHRHALAEALDDLANLRIRSHATAEVCMHRRRALEVLEPVSAQDPSRMAQARCRFGAAQRAHAEALLAAGDATGAASAWRAGHAVLQRTVSEARDDLVARAEFAAAAAGVAAGTQPGSEREALAREAWQALRSLLRRSPDPASRAAMVSAATHLMSLPDGLLGEDPASTRIQLRMVIDGN